MKQKDDFTFRLARNTDLEQIHEALHQEDLPFEDCIDHIDNFVIVEKDGYFAGCGAIELYGHKALLRSVVVDEKYRGLQLGDSILVFIQDMAMTRGVDELFLLTVTAEQYFVKRGFIHVTRHEAPSEIKQTKQFSGLCSDKAIVMLLPLKQ